MTLRTVPTRLAFALATLWAGGAWAQEAEGGQSLAQAASDPTASVASLQISDWYSYDYHQLPDASSNTLNLRLAAPFQAGGLNNIFRLTAPLVFDHPSLDSGLGDMTAFDLVVFNRSWGRFGVGAVALIPTGGDDRGADQWAVGPAVGFVASAGPGLIAGLFNQNLFHVAGDQARGQGDVNISILQPIVSKSLGDGWSLGVSEMQITYDWEAGRFSSLPLGLQLAKLQPVAGKPVQFSLQYEHDFADDRPAPSDTLRFAAKILFTP